ncbi:hypothetical protein JCM10213_005861 [Rhodosporidiobolus nylandii]
MSTLADFALNLHISAEPFPSARQSVRYRAPRTDQVARPKDIPRRIVLDPSLASFELERFAASLQEHTPRRSTPDNLIASFELTLWHLKRSRRETGAGSEDARAVHRSIEYLLWVICDALNKHARPAGSGARITSRDLWRIPDPDADGERLTLHGHCDAVLMEDDGERTMVKHVVEFIGPNASNDTEDAFFSRLKRRMENGMLRLDEALLREDQQLHDMLLKLSTACVSLPCASFSIFDGRSFVFGRLVPDPAKPPSFDILLSPVLPFPLSNAASSAPAVAYASLLLSTCYSHTEMAVYQQRAAAVVEALEGESDLRPLIRSGKPEERAADGARDGPVEESPAQRTVQRLDELSQLPAISLRFSNGLSPSSNVFLRVSPPPIQPLTYGQGAHPSLWAPTSELTAPLPSSAPPPPLLTLASTAGMGKTAIVYRSFPLATDPSSPISPLDSPFPSSDPNALGTVVCAKVAWPGMRVELRHQASLYERAAAAGVSDVVVRFFGLFESGKDENGTVLLTEDGGHRLARIHLFLLVLRLHLTARLLHCDVQPANVVKLSPSPSSTGVAQPLLRLIDPNGDDHPECPGAECWELLELAEALELDNEEGWAELRRAAREAGLEMKGRGGSKGKGGA